MEIAILKKMGLGFFAIRVGAVVLVAFALFFTSATKTTATPTPTPTITATPTPTITASPTPRATATPTPTPNFVFCDRSRGVETGIGCIRYDAPGFAFQMVRIIVGVAGGIVLLLFLIGGTQFISSSADPDALDEAKEKITAAVSGLLLIIFSLAILKIVGVDILNLPGLSSTGGGLTVPGP